ncbi:MAG: hypothetical protein OK449_09310 [Thaumarchaeota archaeon]|nr:hypothetical protein [Nitrososphaerota archaeon]
MSDSLGPALATLSDVAVAFAIVYASYWAFAVRHALVGRTYRSQALWLGVLTILFILVVLAPTPTGNGLVADFLNNAPTVALTLGLFAFVDSTVPIARRSDPLLRNIIHWEKVRFVAWAVLILVEIVTTFAEIESNNTSSATVAGLIAVALIGAPPMLVGARRSMDPNLRGSLKWFGLSLLFFLGIIVVGVVETRLNLSNYYTTSSYGEIPYAAVLILVTYALYRSARSLAPISRLPAIESEMTEVPGAAPPPAPLTPPRSGSPTQANG